MIGRALCAAGLALVFLAPAVSSQSIAVGRLRGRVLEDGVPIRRIVEVVFEGDASGIVDRAYTQGGDEFNFSGLRIDLNDQYFLVIREPGYEEVRHELQINKGLFGSVEFGLVILRLNSLPPEDAYTGASNTVDFRQLTADIPDAARDAYREAMENLDDGASDAALASLELAVRLAPDYYDALNTLGIEYLNRQRYADAEQTLEHAYSLNRNDASLLTNLGTLRFQQGQALEPSAETPTELETVRESYLEATGLLRQALRLDPASARIASYLGSALYKTGAYEEAEETLFLAMESDPDMDQARLALINVYVRQNRAEAALEQIELYLESDPDTAEREAMERAREAIRAAIGR